MNMTVNYINAFGFSYSNYLLTALTTNKNK